MGVASVLNVFSAVVRLGAHDTLFPECCVFAAPFSIAVGLKAKNETCVCYFAFILGVQVVLTNLEVDSTV